MSAFGGHESQKAITTTWLTPPSILNPLGRFDLDPCAAPEPRPWPTADTMYALPGQDGLALPWFGRVWLNPPYNREAVVWLTRLADHGEGTALIFARTETRWFIEQVWKRASLVLFLAGRVRFHQADGTAGSGNGGHNATAPSVLVAYGDRDAEILAGSGLAGSLTNWRVA